MIAATTGLACVLGDPVGHSRSPAMQNAALRDLGLDCVYVAFRVPAAQLGEAVHGLAALGASGANVTLPHKEAAALLCDSLSDEAVAAGAANTLVFEERADTRPSHRRARDARRAPRRGRRCQRPVRRSCWARVDRRAPRSRRCSQPGRRPCACSRGATRPRGRSPAALAPLGRVEVIDELPAGPLGIVANCTPVGALTELEALPVPADALDRMDIVCDFAYRADGSTTPVIAAAAARGLRSVDGLELLVRQGARSFELFFGVPAPLDVMRRAASGVE